MKPPAQIELGSGREAIRFEILHEDRSVIAIDKPAGWLLIPFSWQSTNRNLAAALASSIAAREFWARSRNLKFLRHVHRLDGETSGILLLAKSLGAVNTFSRLFETRRMEKTYLAVVEGIPRQTEWICREPLAPDPRNIGKIIADKRQGKPAETAFRLLETSGGRSLIQAEPYTGRTHQIRVHLQLAGVPVAGDELYGAQENLQGRAGRSQPRRFPLGLRAVRLVYQDPFRRQRVQIDAPSEEFLRAFGMRRESFATSRPPESSPAAKARPID